MYVGPLCVLKGRVHMVTGIPENMSGGVPEKFSKLRTSIYKLCEHFSAGYTISPTMEYDNRTSGAKLMEIGARCCTSWAPILLATYCIGPHDHVPFLLRYEFRDVTPPPIRK